MDRSAWLLLNCRRSRAGDSSLGGATRRSTNGLDMLAIVLIAGFLGVLGAGR
jgi:hypothetical protein